MKSEKTAYTLISIAGIFSILSLLYIGFRIAAGHAKFEDYSLGDHFIEICMVIIYISYSISRRKTKAKSS